MMAVVAPSATPAYTFTNANSGIQANYASSTCFSLVANGISNAPSFPANWANATGGSYTNTAGVLNEVTISSDGWSTTWQIDLGAAPQAIVIPTPVSFVGSIGTQHLTITYGGAGTALGAYTPPLSAFSLTASRPSAFPGLQATIPYTLGGINAVAANATTVTLTLAGFGAFASGDIVTLSYNPPTSNPLQDNLLPTNNKLPFFVNAAVTVE